MPTIYNNAQLTACVKKLFEICEQKQSLIDALTEQVTAIEEKCIGIDIRLTALEDSNPGALVIATQSAVEDDSYVSVDISDGPSPTFIFNNGAVSATNITVTGGSGANGNGRIYTLTFPAHPLGASYQAIIQPWDDTQPDTATPEILAQTPTTLTYQLPQGDDGSSEDDNDYYRHTVFIAGINQTFLTGVTVNGNPV